MRFLLVALITLSSSAFAHEGAPKAAVERPAASGPLVEDSVIVNATLAELQPRLLDVECWPELFSDARRLERKGEVWSVDFKQFGHAHPFTIRREPRAVMFELADAKHGAAKLEYRLRPVDAKRSRLTVRLEMQTPPQLTAEQATRLMRSKVDADLRDFARATLKGKTP